VMIDARGLAETGYAVVDGLISLNEAEAIARLIDGAMVDNAGTRRLLDAPWCSALAERLALDPRLRDAMPVDATAVQCTLFVKSPEKNWLASLHQDLSVPVAERLESARCSGWSEKEGEVFVQPPIHVLEQALAVRLHLDDCDERNGALRIVPGSHLLGRLTPSHAAKLRIDHGEDVVKVSRGGGMLLKPLVLHASSKVSVERPRRVLHFLFGPKILPEGLRWPSQSERLISTAKGCDRGNHLAVGSAVPNLLFGSKRSSAL
jgi:phytanoyl-CoA dioxygenase PhyH